MIKVLVVEDSPAVREFLVHILGSAPGICVVGTANNGEEAIEAVERLQPDVITMDIHMPIMDGLEATRQIMETHPTPIVAVSGNTDLNDVAMMFRITDAGALAVLRRPAGMGHPDFESSVKELIQTVKLMSEVKVVRRWSRVQREATIFSRLVERDLEHMSIKVEVVALGASTGGPSVLQTILTALPKSFPTPVLIVQHMTSGFTQGFVEWLSLSSVLPIHVARHGEIIISGHAYVAPDEYHMKVERGGKIVLTQEALENGLRPSVSKLFRSVADTYGSNALVGLLTGMGRDGAEELKLLKDKGAVTFAQDKDSSIVHGMPGEAIKLNAATLVLPSEKIASLLTSLTNRKK
ncbi:MAG: two-component system, chemotaxis family, response regulator CheB [Candidatus Nitrotoga sp. SPKER]|nr:MAG: two-component system, chemotaxis family, response regulator CheB [Candidatus Nitrotoga sp. SPKER]